jgi:small multidrug resistance pump
MIKIIIYLLLTVSGINFFKMGSELTSFRIDLQSMHLSVSYLAAIGLFCYVASFLLWLNILQNNQLTYIIPIATGIGTILILISGVVIFKEVVTPLKIAGILLIIIGVFLINLKTK